MANTLYTAARQKFLTGEWDWDTMSPEVIFVKEGYIYNEYHTLAADLGEPNIVDREYRPGALPRRGE